MHKIHGPVYFRVFSFGGSRLRRNVGQQARTITGAMEIHSTDLQSFLGEFVACVLFLHK